MGSPRPKTAPSKQSTNSADKAHEEIDDEAVIMQEDIDLIHYLYYISRQKVGLQHHPSKIRPPTEFRESYNLNHPELKKGQKIYLNNLCQIYSIKDLIIGTKKQFNETLLNRKTTGLHLKEEFTNYEKYLKSHRLLPNKNLNTGHFSPLKLKTTRKESKTNKKKR
jgi:hypothetical protein